MTFHTDCAVSNCRYDPFDVGGNVPFHCDPCAMQRSSLTPHTPDQSFEHSNSHRMCTESPVTLDHIIKQLKYSMMTTDKRWEQIRGSWAGMERNIVEIRVDLAN